MSTISNIIFNGKKHYITSSYGKRASISTSKGVTSTFHRGTDYGTDNIKLPQYAIESGSVISCGTASDGAKFVWINYPRIGKKFLHYHLDSIAVRSGQTVIKGTKIGTTGKTGKATGIHLHLGIKDSRTNLYEDPEIFSKAYKIPGTASSTQNTYKIGTYKVTATVLNVRSGAGKSYSAKSFNTFTKDAQSQVKKLNSGKSCNGYVLGTVCTVSKISNDCWGKTPSGWICLDYCKKVA